VRLGAGEGAPGTVLALPPRDAGLLAWLAIRGPTDRATLAALLWPESDAEASRNSLRQRLFRLRRQLGLDVAVGVTVLSLADGIPHDLAEADTVLGHDAHDYSDEFQSWLTDERARRSERARSQWAALADRAEAERDWPGALAYAQRLLMLDRLREDEHRRLMRLHYLAGNRSAALQAFDACERVLKAEMGSLPDARTQSLLRQIVASTVPALAPAGREVPASVSRPVRMVGREAFWHALHQAQAHGRHAVVLGEGGLGKTRLLGDFVQAHPGALYVSARPGDQRVPYATVSRLLRAVHPAAAQSLAAPLQQELSRLLPELGEASPVSGGAARTRFYNAVGAALDAAVATLLVVDDLHFADDASLEMIGYLVGRGARCWLLAGREGELSAAARTLVDEVTAAAAEPPLVLTPLVQAQVAELIDSLAIDGLVGAQAAAPLLAHTGGNPMFLLEAVKAWWLQGAQGAPGRLAASTTVTALIGRRIGRLSPGAVRLARCAALATPDFSIELAAAVLGERALDLADPYAELEAAHILQDGAFAHDLIHEAALASVPRLVAASLHGSVAQWLAEHGGPPERVAAHFAQAGRPAQAAPFWRAAGERAQGALRFAEAADAFERAALGFAEAGANESAFDVAYAMRLASFEVDLRERSGAALALLERLAATPLQQGRAANERAVTLLHQGDLQGAHAAALAGLRALGGADEPLLRAELRRNLAAVHLWRNETQAAMNEMRSIEFTIDQLGAPRQRAEFQGSLALVLEHADECAAARRANERAVELMLQLGDAPGAAQTLLNQAVGEHDQGDLRAALVYLERARLLLAALPESARSYSSLDLNLGFVLCGLGDYEAALRHIDLAVDSARIQTPGWLPLMQAYRAQLWLHLGQFARAGQELEAARPDEGTPLMARSRWTVVHSRLPLAAPEARQAAAEGLRALVAQLPVHGRRLSFWRPQVALLPFLPDDEAMATARVLLAELQAAGRVGLQINVGSELVERLHRSGQADEALAQAQATLALLDVQVPDGLYRGDIWRQCLPALAKAEPALHAQRLQQAVAWIEDTASRRVPPAFQASFLDRNAANRALRGWATRRLG